MATEHLISWAAPLAHIEGRNQSALGACGLPASAVEHGSRFSRLYPDRGTSDDAGDIGGTMPCCGCMPDRVRMGFCFNDPTAMGV